MAELAYPIVVTQVDEQDGGGYTAFAPDLLGCMGDGATKEEALADVEAAIGEWIDEAKRLQRKIPVPGSAGRRASQELKDLRELVCRQDEVLRMQNEALDSAKAELEQYRATLADIDCDDEYLSNWADTGALVVSTLRKRNGDDSLPH